jgi:hypothetical protein
MDTGSGCTRLGRRCFSSCRLRGCAAALAVGCIGCNVVDGGQIRPFYRVERVLDQMTKKSARGPLTPEMKEAERVKPNTQVVGSAQERRRERNEFSSALRGKKCEKAPSAGERVSACLRTTTSSPPVWPLRSSPTPFSRPSTLPTRSHPSLPTQHRFRIGLSHRTTLTSLCLPPPSRPFEP